MTKQKLKQLVKDYQEERGSEKLTRMDMEYFTQEYEYELDFSCEEIEKPDDRYMIAQLSGFVLSANKKWSYYVSLIFDWEAIPDYLENIKDQDEFVNRIWKLYQKAQNIREGTFNFSNK